MIRKRDNGYWYTDFVLSDGSRVRRSLGKHVASEREAKRAARRLFKEMEQALLDRRAGAPPRVAFSGFADHWFETHVRVNCKPSVQRRYESMIRVHLVPIFEHRELHTLTTEDVEKAKATWSRTKHPHTGKPLSAKTVNEHLACLASMLEKAVEWDYLAENPARKVKRLRLEPPQHAWLNAEQIAAFLDACREGEPAWFALVFAGFHTGMRLGELLALRWECVDFDGEQIEVRRSRTRGVTTSPKGHKRRFVPLSKPLAEILRGVPRSAEGLLFVHKDGRPITRDMLKHPFERLYKAAEVPRITPHDMRHSYASLLVSRGAPLNLVQQLLGHVDIQTTLRYAHLAPKDGLPWINNLPVPSSESAQSGHTPEGAQQESTDNTGKSMVEAAGIEPASETARPPLLRA